MARGAWSVVIDTLNKLEHSGTVIRQPLGAFRLLCAVLSHFESPRIVGQADAWVKWVWGDGGWGVTAQDVELAEESEHAPLIIESVDEGLCSVASFG